MINDCKLCDKLWNKHVIYLFSMSRNWKDVGFDLDKETLVSRKQLDEFHERRHEKNE